MEAHAMSCVRSGVWTVVAAFGLVGAAATARGSDPDRTQAQDVEAIERVGGFVTPGGWILPEGTVVGIEGSKATDGDLIHLRSLKSVRVMVLDGTWITDAGIAHLSRREGTCSA
jgi:hypothetical protein